MIEREITGPQAQFERSGHEALRDVRSFTTRFSQGLRGQASGLVLGAMAAVTFFVPAVVDLTVVGGALYAAWVLTRRIEAPVRLPRSARRRDWSDPDPETRKPRMAAGEIFVGWDHLTGQEIWISNEDLRQHSTIPGTTGAGKTTTLMSSLANPLAHGSGWCVVDGKANAELYGQGYVLARRVGREDDLQVINLLTASLAAEATAHGYNAHAQTNSFNPFATGNADALRELLASQLGEAPSNDANGVFRGRAVALIGTIAPVLVWMRDHKGVPIDIEKIRHMVELKSIWMLATHKVFLSLDADTNVVTEIPVRDMPANLLYPLQAYLNEIPGYDTTLPYNEQKTEKPSEQHGYAVFYFTSTFTTLAVSLGHIFRIEQGDIEMRDVVMNRRLLIVNLPALEKSDDSLAALGRIVVASLRGMMAQQLGAKLEGDPKEIFAHKPGMGIGSFQVYFDEIGYYATSGMDRMLAMGRGLNMAFGIAFQELGGIWARLGEKTYSLLGNANLTLGMRQQDSGRTREWLEKTAGQSWVTQATSFQGGHHGAYREAGNADLRQVSRVAWQDFLTLLPGEAIVLFGGRRIHAKLFRAPLDVTGSPRLNRPLMLAAPVAHEVRSFPERIAALRDRIEEGLPFEGQDEHVSGVLDAMIKALVDTARQGMTTSGCIEAMIEAAAPVSPGDTGESANALPPRLPDPAGGEDDAADEAALQPVTEFTPMLDIATEARPPAPARPDRPREPVDARLRADLVAIEVAAGAPKVAALASALATLGDGDAALSAITWPEPPPMQEGELRERIERLNAQLAPLCVVLPPDSGLREAAE